MDVFISYRRTGTHQARTIYDSLTAKGIKAFFDTDQIKHEKDFTKRIKGGIDSAPNFLMILTKDYFLERKDEKDWVRAELKYAYEQNKHFIGVMFEDYDRYAIDFANEVPEVAQFQHASFIPYDLRFHDYTMEQIVEAFLGEDGKAFSIIRGPEKNRWYAGKTISEEDRLWMWQDAKVCKKFDWMNYKRIFKHPILSKRDKLHLFSYKMYDIDSYAEKFGVVDGDRQFDEIYGVTFKVYLEAANERFGKGHFISDEGVSSSYLKAVKKLLKDNNLPGFDVIDATLVLKDVDDPLKRLHEMVELLNPKGGIIYIRDLDDDFVDAYPDKDGYIKKLKEYLELDPGAGNRHFGKQIYTYFRMAGADSIYMSDKLISTANMKNREQNDLCDAYFSYLKPEFYQLVSDNPDNREFRKAKVWIDKHYQEIKQMFSSTEFYFRAGYVAGYAVFEGEDDDEDDE